MKRIKNIRLISDTDSSYLEYLKTFKSNNEEPLKKERSKSEMISYVLELVVREWVKSSGARYDKRIISFEQFDRNSQTYITRFQEIDYVLMNKQLIFLGEVKASFDDSKIISKAAKQLSWKMALLNMLGYHAKGQIIHFDLSYLHTSKVLHAFNPNFRNINFSVVSRNNVDFDYLHLSPLEIYDWGLKNKIIKTPELLEAAIEEAEIRFNNKNEKRLLKRKSVSDDSKNHIGITIGKFSNSTQGLCKKSEAIPNTNEIKKVIISVEESQLVQDSIIIARYNWMKKNMFIIPESSRLMNLCIQIQNHVVKRAFYSDTMGYLLKKLNYQIIILN